MSDAASDTYPPPAAHDPFVELFPDVFMVRGSMQMNSFMRFSRNMVVVRSGADLTVLNSMRLTAAGEAALDQLGRVRHVLRLGYFHGRDDAYYVDQYGARFWAAEGSRTEPGPAATDILSDDADLPIPDAQLFSFQHTRHPELAVLLQSNGGVLITCDALQHYADRRFSSLFARLAMPLMGFPLKMLIGPLWLKAMTPKEPPGSLRADFERLLELEFAHLLPAHGSARLDDAHSAAAEAIHGTFFKAGNKLS